MAQLLNDASMLWTQDLTVGSQTIDARNRQLFMRLDGAETMIASSSSEHLEQWLTQMFDEFETTLAAEEDELVMIGYPELEFHRRMHEQGRNIVRTSRMQIARSHSATWVEAIARDTCSALSVWMMRHVIEADKMFVPYIGARFRDV